MKKYIKRYINSQTGMAEHIQVSTEPTHDHIDFEVIESIPVVIPGEPPIPPLKFEIEEIEIEEEIPMRAREYLEAFNKPQAEQDADQRWLEEARSAKRDMKKT